MSVTTLKLHRSSASNLSNAVAVSPNGRLLAATSANRVMLWSLSPRVRPGRSVRAHIGVYTAAFSPDNVWLALGHRDGVVDIWCMVPTFRSPAAQTETTRNSSSSSVGDSSDSSKCDNVGSSTTKQSNDNHASENVAEHHNHKDHHKVNDEHEHEHEHEQQAGQGMDNDDLPHVVVGYHFDAVHSVCFSPNPGRGQRRVLVSGSAGETVRVWMQHEPDVVVRDPVDRGTVTHMVAPGSWVMTMELAAGHGVVDLAFTPATSRLLAACAGNTVQLWPIKSAAAMARDRAVAVMDEAERLRDPQGWRPQPQLSRGQFTDDAAKAILSVCFASDKLMAIGTDDSTITLLSVCQISSRSSSNNKNTDGNVRTGHADNDSVRSGAAIASSKYAEDRNQDHEQENDMDDENGENDRDMAEREFLFEDLFTVRTCAFHSSWVNSVAFSSDGRFLVSGSMDGRVCLWRVHDAQLAQPSLSVASVMTGHESHVNKAVFSPCGRQVISCADDATVRLWAVCAWSDRVHRLFAPSLWQTVFALMCVRHRLDKSCNHTTGPNKLAICTPRAIDNNSISRTASSGSSNSSSIPDAVERASSSTSTSSTSSTSSRSSVFPRLAMELWLNIFMFLPKPAQAGDMDIDILHHPFERRQREDVPREEGDDDDDEEEEEGGGGGGGGDEDQDNDEDEDEDDDWMEYQSMMDMERRAPS